MKYVITERQYRVITEQVKPILTPSNQSSSLKPTMNVASGTINPTNGLSSGDLHDLMAVLAIGTAFIPVAGPFISAGIGLADAGMYYKEGDNKSAGITAALSMLPFIGKIPGVKELGAKGMAALSSKLNFGGKLTQSEINVVKNIISNPNLVKSELTIAAKKISPIIKQIESLKPNYIKQFGQQAYENQLSKLVKNEIGKDEFLKILSSNKTTGVVKGVKGVVMSADEINKITSMADKISKGQIPSNSILKVKIGDAIQEIPVEFVSMEGNMIGGYNPITNRFRFNVKNLPKNADEIKRTIYHEVTHAKDPMPQFFKQNKTGQYYVTGSGTHYADQAEKISSKMIEIKKSIPKGQKLPKEYYDLKNQRDELFAKYEYAPSEKTANFQMIYNSIPDKINSIIKHYPSKFGKKKSMDMLNSILNYFKRGGGGNIETIIGARQVEYLNKLKKFDLKQYNEVVKKITQEVENLKSQL
jgi:hypothetical protein